MYDRFVSEIDLRDKNSIEEDILVFESRKVAHRMLDSSGSLNEKYSIETPSTALFSQ